jgi:hypothetical protein
MYLRVGKPTLYILIWDFLVYNSAYAYELSFLRKL